MRKFILTCGVSKKDGVVKVGKCNMLAIDETQQPCEENAEDIVCSKKTSGFSSKEL